MDRLQVIEMLWLEHGIECFPVDKEHVLRPMSWYMKAPSWRGWQHLRYRADGADCDDRASILDAEWKLKNIRECHRLDSCPALPVGIVDAKMSSGLLHRFNFIICADCCGQPEFYFIERAKKGLRLVSRSEIAKIERAWM